MGRLRRSRVDGPGIRRLRRGRGFSYRSDADPSAAIRDEATLERIRTLAIPPAWNGVWIAPGPDGHIQAVGVDEAGRRQYLYHPRWRVRADRAKFERMLRFAAALPAARRGVTADLRSPGLGRDRVLAGAFRLLDSGGLRMGSVRAVDEHGSFGLTTLRRAHARVDGDGDEIELAFPGKSAQPWRSRIHDRELAALVAELRSGRGRAPLLSWADEDGRRHPLRPEEINDEVRGRTGVDATAKDFRTLRGTATAALSLARSGPETTVTGRRRAVAAAMRDAAEALGNTPAIARSSYVDPRVVDCYDRGETIDPRSRRTIESQLIDLLGG